MAKINQDLIERLKTKLGLGPAAVYNRIHATGRKHHVPRRDLAALLLAWEHGISIQKYADDEQMDRIAGVTGDAPTASAPTPSAPRGRKGKTAKPKRSKSNSVFVVHGRDEELRHSMFEFLRALGLNPMEWSTAVAQAKGGNPYIGDILDAAMDKVQAVVVLFSPDELAQLKEQFWGADDKHGDGRLAGQARPNVIFEAGLALGAHPEKTVIVQVGRVRPFSDIAGKHLVRLSQDKGRVDLANRLKKLGCPVVTTGEDWMKAGYFEPTEAKPRKARKPKSRKKRR